MKTIDQISAVDWQPKLGDIGEVVEDIADINQCIVSFFLPQKVLTLTDQSLAQIYGNILTTQ
jgi:hypothetical protein